MDGSIRFDTKGETMRATYKTATWDASDEAYVIRDTDLWSPDGDQWYQGNDAMPANGPEFDSMTISLVGGSRDGVTVA